MERLKTMQSKVEDILAQYPKARDNDKILVGGIYALYYDVDVHHETFADVIMREDLPNFETIRRCRQKAQADYPELRGKKDKERLDAQKSFVEYALSDR